MTVLRCIALRTRLGMGFRLGLTVLSLALVTGCGGDDDIVDPPKPDDPAIKVQNNSALTIVDVFYSSCSATVFGDDRLSGSIAPGQSQTFTEDVEAGCFDVLVVNSDGGQAQFGAQQISGITTVTVTNF